MGVTTWLVDKSALVRLGTVDDAHEWAEITKQPHERLS